MRRFALVLMLFTAVGWHAAEVAAAPARRPQFDPATTWAVVAGVLEWPDPALPPFSKHHRKDQELFDLLGARGVPEAQRVLLLDQEATTANILAAIDRLVAAAPAGSTFIFYFAGHGVKDGEDISLASYDTSSKNWKTSGVRVDGLAAHFAGKFRGKRVIFLADCCHSGGLALPAAELGKAGYETLALTSAESSNLSTSNWTFTQSVIDALRGRALGDRDADGTISLAELRQEVAESMRFREGQRYGWEDHGVPLAWTLSPVRTEGPRAARSQWVIARQTEKHKEAPARVLAAKGDQVLVSFYRYSEEETVWVARAETQPIEFYSFPKDEPIQVLWMGKWYDAKILKVSDGFHLISYTAFKGTRDEWVLANRIRPRPPGAPAERKIAQVEWNGRWWDAVVNSEKDGTFCISYVGYASNWDECVPPARIRF